MTLLAFCQLVIGGNSAVDAESPSGAQVDRTRHAHSHEARFDFWGLCLPMARALPIFDKGGFGTPPIFVQLFKYRFAGKSIHIAALENKQ